ncbi:MAG: GntR family transcriptional regulator [Steroidobacteraceae bacterium]
MKQRSSSAKRLPEINALSLRQRVLETLRAAIINGDIKPGSKLTEELISEQMRVSRGPVREALRELEQEGLIITTPYKGTEVLDISDREVFELLMPIRLVIEEFGFRCAVERMSSEDLIDLEHIVERMSRAAERGDVDGVAVADVAFHEKALRISGHLHCLQIWRTISPRVRAYFARVRHNDPDLGEVVEEHRLLLGDLRRRIVPDLMSRLREHIFTIPMSKHTPLQRGRGRSALGAKKQTNDTPAPRRRKRPGSVAAR